MELWRWKYLRTFWIGRITVEYRVARYFNANTFQYRIHFSTILFVQIEINTIISEWVMKPYKSNQSMRSKLLQ